jgi:uncharacterized membrane protein YfcA
VAVDTAALAGVCAAVVLGAGLQRVAGMGLGMVAAPVLTLVLGPVTGVIVSNAGAVVTAVLVLGTLHGNVDWPRFGRMVPLVVVGSVLGALAVRTFPIAWLDLLVGGSVLLALVASLGLRRRRALRPSATAAVVTGLAAGFMNTTSGVAAPAMTAYAVATRWEHHAFIATLQPVLVVANVTSLVTKTLLGDVADDVALPWWIWPVVVGAVVLGVGLGGRLARRVSSRLARRVAVGIAATGATTALVRGVVGL